MGSKLFKLASIWYKRLIPPSMPETSILTSQIAAIFVFATSPYIFIFYFFGSQFLGLLAVPFVIIFCLILYLNQAGYYKISKISLVLGIAIPIFIYSCFLGPKAGIQLAYFALLAIPFVIFSPQEIKGRSFGSFSTLSLMIVLEYINYNVGIRVHFSNSILKSVYYTIIFITGSIIILTIQFYFIQLQGSKKRLQDSHSDLQTSHKQLETAYDDLQQSNSIIDSLSQQAAMGALVRGIAHEVKNPLAAIYSSCSNLLAEPLTENVQMEIKAIQTSVFQLDYLTNTLLNHSGKMVIGNQWIQLNDILSQLLKLVDNEAFIRKISIHRHLQKNLPRIMGNAAYVSQAVLNLLVNALEHTPHGSITVRSHAFVEMGKLKVGIQVQDNGAGIPSDLLPHIFDPNKSFGKSVSAKTTPQINAGLGLFFVKRVMDAHDGEARVSSVLGKGTNFELVFDGETC